MGLFSDMLSDGESLFRDEIALDYDYLPKLLPYREKEQHHIASCIKPLLMGRSGRNLLLSGPPGIGKTAATKFVLRDLEDETDDVIPIYVNCWQRNTSFKIFTYICEELGHKFIQNKKTEELFKLIRETVNKKAAVFVFDEIDKVEEYDFLYNLLEEINYKSIILLTNYKEWVVNLDMRVKSRLIPDMVDFKSYNQEETRGILKQRSDIAFAPGVWDSSAFEAIVKTTAQLGDVRTGLYLLREAALNAEQRSLKKIMPEHVEKVIDKLSEFSRKDTSELNDEERFVFTIAKGNSGSRIGSLFEIYKKEGGRLTYKSFQRYIGRLSDNGFIKTKKVTGGTEGTTTIIECGVVRKPKVEETQQATDMFTSAADAQNKSLKDYR